MNVKKNQLTRVAAAITILCLAISVLTANVFASVVGSGVKKVVKEVTFYDKNPDPAASNEMATFPAVWVLYEDQTGGDNLEVFALKEVATEEEANNTNFGIKGYRHNGKWYRIIGLWTVDPGHDIIDKGHGEKAVFTPLYYDEDGKPEPGDKGFISIYDNEQNSFSDPVEFTYPEAGQEVNVKAGGETCKHDGGRLYVSKGETGHSVVCAKCQAVLEAEVPHTDATYGFQYNEEKHWHECPDCGQVYAEGAHVWIKGGPSGDFNGYKCECGATKEFEKPDLGAAVVNVDDTRTYTEEEAKQLELTIDGKKVDKDSYVVNVEPDKADENKLVVTFEPAGDKSTGKKVIEVNKTPDAGTVTDAPPATDVPAATDAPSATDVPASTDAPSATDVPAATDATSATDVPAATDAPSATDEPSESKGQFPVGAIIGIAAGVVAIGALAAYLVISKKKK